MKEKEIIVTENTGILKKCSFEIFLKLIISVLFRGILLIIPILWGKAIDAVTAGLYKKSYIIILVTLTFTILYYIAICINNLVYFKLYNKLYHKYNTLIYKSIVDNSLYSLSRFKIGEFSNVVNSDIDIVVAFISNSIANIVRILEFFIIFYYFYIINSNIFLATFIICILVFIRIVNKQKKKQNYNQHRKYHLDKKVAITNEVFNTIKEIKGFYIFKNINERVTLTCKQYLNANKKYDNLITTTKQISLCLIEIFRYLAAIYGVYLCSQNKMEIGSILVIYSYYGKLTENFGIIENFMNEIADFKVSLKRLNKLLEYRIIKNNNTLIENKNYQGDIKFKNILYGNKKDPILNNVTLKIDKNSITAITGNPGTGKTGVFDLLMKMNRQHQGEILIDNINYEDIDDKTYYNLVSIVRKDPHFFDISIKDNLMIVSQNFSKVKKVCEQLGIHDEIMKLKHKYNTLVNSTNDKISNNLKTSLAIARVILKNSKIMMFDEAISSLDKEHQEKVISLLKELSLNHTIILITRNNDILKIADKIILFENNRVKKISLNKD